MKHVIFFSFPWVLTLFCCKFFVTGLEEVKDFLEDSFPNATVAIAHGKVGYFILIQICVSFG